MPMEGEVRVGLSFPSLVVEPALDGPSEKKGIKVRIIG